MHFPVCFIKVYISLFIKVCFVKAQRFERTLYRTLVRGEGPTLETLDFTIHIGSAPTLLYFDLYLNTAYAAHYVYLINKIWLLYRKPKNAITLLWNIICLV